MFLSHHLIFLNLDFLNFLDFKQVPNSFSYGQNNILLVGQGLLVIRLPLVISTCLKHLLCLWTSIEGSNVNQTPVLLPFAVKKEVPCSSGALLHFKYLLLIQFSFYSIPNYVSLSDFAWSLGMKDF